MKKLISLIMIAAMLSANGASAYADVSKSVTITITISHSLNLELTGNLDLTIIPGQTAVSDNALEIKNTGTGITETVTLTAAVPAGWSAAFQFADTKPLPASGNWKKADQLAGKALAYNEAGKLWLKLTAPAVVEKPSVTITLEATAK